MVICVIGRFVNSLWDEYDQAGVHGFSVWGRSKKMCMNIHRNMTFGCDAYNMRPPCLDKGHQCFYLSMHISECNVKSL